MENLIIEHSRQAISRKVIGGLWIMIAIGTLIFKKDMNGENDWGRPIAFFIIGVVFFTPLMGSSRSQIEIGEGYIKIIWTNWFRKITIQESDIEKIVLAKDGIKIYRRDKKAVKILLFYMEKEQKDQVYKFFCEYAHLKNLVLGK
jgi:hypothetical protein